MRYEWCHFLSHSPYQPKSERFRRVLVAHRLHHFKNEHYWMGVTSYLGDRTLGTYPDQHSVEKSPTVRTLGVPT